jgi:hypothetical protein
LAVLPAAAADEQVYTEGYFYYTVSDQSITIVGYFGTEAIVTVPASIAGIPVNAVGPNAFAGTGVQILYLPDTVRELGENATGNADVRFIGQPTTEPQQNPDETPAPGGSTAPGSSSGSNEEVIGAEPPEENVTSPTPVSETPSPEQTPSVTTDGPDPTADAGTETTTEPVGQTAEAGDVSTANEPIAEAPVESADPARTTVSEQPKNMTWLWVTLGAAAVVCGAAAGVAAAKKAKKK